MTKDAWLVVGNGAIGLLWASKLKAQGDEVTVVCRQHPPSAPLQVDFLDEDDQPQSEHYPVEFVTRDQLEGKYTKVLLCTKAFDLVAAYLDIRQHTKKRGLIATLCNGVGAQQDLIPHLKKHQNLWAGVTSEGALKLDDHRVKKTGRGDSFFGLLHQSSKNAIGPEFPYPNVQSENIERRLVEKLAINAVINPITAIFSIRNGQLLEEPVRPIFDAAIEEIAEVLNHEQFPYPADQLRINTQTLHQRISTVARFTALNCSSMYEDIRNLRRTENEYISGFFHRHTPRDTTPIQDFFYNALNDRAHLEEHKKKLLTMF
ncbi:ketopantoate reductase family protein [Marinomonas ostreistagni]|uniref:ketopantoate reductase family protein n=1 Tax=Marinomonas ostreistagni TaxID=359209 RepID=UPI001950F01E|nr:2-dehydropantoate 2-reductase [Marinomonas ostreistagni]MBM6550108.1 2-dehydropantoate 2-reductase [Marinomonas ostreistagni]